MSRVNDDDAVDLVGQVMQLIKASISNHRIVRDFHDAIGFFLDMLGVAQQSLEGVKHLLEVAESGFAFPLDAIILLREAILHGNACIDEWASKKELRTGLFPCAYPKKLRAAGSEVRGAVQLIAVSLANGGDGETSRTGQTLYDMISKNGARSGTVFPLQTTRKMVLSMLLLTVLVFLPTFRDTSPAHEQFSSASVYHQIDCFLYGMDEKTIDAPAALTLAQRNCADEPDPVLLATQALLFIGPPSKYFGIEANASHGEELCQLALDSGLETRALHGDPFAQFALGSLFHYGHIGGSGPDYVKAQELYEAAAAKGHASSQSRLGELYEKGHVDGHVLNYHMDMEWYEKAAAQGHADAQYHLGIVYRYQWKSNALEWFERAASQGHVSAMLETAYRYHIGDFVGKPDHSKAQKWYEKAASLGHVTAMHELAGLYDFGFIDGEPGYFRAKYWYKKAAAQDHVESNYRLGSLYRSEHDYIKALEWYEKPAVQGHADAQYAIGKIYDYGDIWNDTILPNVSWAIYWYEKAAVQGHEMAQFSLGLLYEHDPIGGQDGRPDYAKSRYWYKKAAAQGNEVAQDQLERLSEMRRRKWRWFRLGSRE